MRLPDTPYKGLMPFYEEDALFFFGRENLWENIADNLMAFRLTLVYGASGVGKSSVLRAGVAHHLRQRAKQNLANYGQPEFAVVVFSSWSEDPLEGLKKQIEADIKRIFKVKAPQSDLSFVGTLKHWTECLGGEDVGGQLFIILDQFEEYFQYHSQEEEEGTFAVEFPRAVNRPDLAVNFLISIREDALARLDHFQGLIPSLFDNRLEVENLNKKRHSGWEAIEKPIEEYNHQQVIIDNLGDSRLTVLYGASGVGKTSILEAGIAHRLRQAAKQNLEDRGIPKFAVVVFNSWCDDPLERLKQQIEVNIKKIFSDVQKLELQAPESGLPFIETLQEWTKRLGGENGDGKLFIILDQFEEYFQYHLQEEGERRFADEFIDAVNCSDLAVNWLISIREDSLDKLNNRFQGLIANQCDRYLHLFDKDIRIETLEQQLADTATIEPVEKYTIEPELAKEVLNQVEIGQVDLFETGRGGTDSTSQTSLEKGIEAPYLQLVMERLWKEEIEELDSHCLRKKTLDSLADSERHLTGAQRIAKDHVYARMEDLLPKQQEAAAYIFRWLVTPSGYKHAYCAEDLVKSVNEDRGNSSVKLELETVKYLLDELTKGDRRLLRPLSLLTQTDVEQLYEIFHDILAQSILEWRREYFGKQRLKKEQERAKLRIQAEEAKRSAEWQWKTRFASGFLAFDVVLLVFLGTVYSLYFKAQGEIKQVAASEVKQAQEDFSKSGSGQIKSLVKAMKGGQHLHNLSTPFLTWHSSFKPSNPEINNSIDYLQDILKGIRQKNQLKVSQRVTVSSVSFSPNGETIATGSFDSTVFLWDLRGNRKKKFKAQKAPVSSVSFSPDGQTIAASYTNGTVVLWDLQGNLKQEFKAHKKGPPPILTISFSPDGQTIATGSTDGTVALWDLQGNLKQEFKAHKGPILSVSFSPDMEAKLLATGSNVGIKLWELQDQREPIEPKFSNDRVSVLSVGFSPDGKALASGSEDGIARLWKLQDLKQPPKKLEVSLGRGLRSFSFSRDGKVLVTGSDNGLISLWDLENNKEELKLLGHQRSVLSVSLKSDEKKEPELLVTGSADGTAPLWDLQNTALQVDGSLERLEGWDKLDKLLFKSGCNWLKDYLAAHPDEREKLPRCK